MEIETAIKIIEEELRECEKEKYRPFMPSMDAVRALLDKCKPLFPGLDFKTRIDAICLVDAERERQNAKWGRQDHHQLLWCSILTEEVGEYAQAVNETVFDNGPDERKKGGYDNLMRELSHVAAVAVAAMECLMRNGLPFEEGGTQ